MPKFLSNRNKSTDLHCKAIGRFPQKKELTLGGLKTIHKYKKLFKSTLQS